MGNFKTSNMLGTDHFFLFEGMYSSPRLLCILSYDVHQRFIKLLYGWSLVLDLLLHRYEPEAVFECGRPRELACV